MYIKNAVAISPQETFDNGFFNRGPKILSGTRFHAFEPDYETLIPRKQLRRMGKALKMSIATSKPVFQATNNFDAIVIGTAHGGMEGSIEFINQIIDLKEGLLSPAGFINSTPNAIAGFLAKKTQSTGYNNTHTNEGLSFEGAMSDVQLLIENNEASQVLLGAVEEISDYNYNLEFAEGLIKKDQRVNSNNLFELKTPGSVAGEGAAMFFVESKPDSAIAKICGLKTIAFPTNDELTKTLDLLLNEVGIISNQIDTVIYGRSGDSRYDNRYDTIADLFPHANALTYKNLVGDYPTSTAFATWLACQVLVGKNIPEEVIQKKIQNDPKTILIYNHYYDKQHSFILLKRGR